MVDPTFRNINRLFVLSIKKDDKDLTRDPRHKHYMPLVEIKDFNTLIDNKPFFDHPVKNKHEAYEKPVKKRMTIHQETSYIIYHQKYYKTIGTDLSRQKNTSIP